MQPNEAQIFEYLPEPGTFDGTRYWGRIYVTSEELVPSVEVAANDADSCISTVLVYYAPGDFKRFALPEVWAGGGFPLPPIGGIKPKERRQVSSGVRSRERAAGQRLAITVAAAQNWLRR